MTVVRGFLITIGSGVVFGVVGGLLGYGLGRFVPDYYRSMFRIPSGVEVDPAEVGLGLGFTQGLIAGLFIGLVIVIVVAWSNSRQSQGSK